MWTYTITPMAVAVSSTRRHLCYDGVATLREKLGNHQEEKGVKNVPKHNEIHLCYQRLSSKPQWSLQAEAINVLAHDCTQDVTPLNLTRHMPGFLCVMPGFWDFKYSGTCFLERCFRILPSPFFPTTSAHNTHTHTDLYIHIHTTSSSWITTAPFLKQGNVTFLPKLVRCTKMCVHVSLARECPCTLPAKEDDLPEGMSRLKEKA